MPSAFDGYLPNGWEDRTTTRNGAITIKWDHDTQQWIATDPNRPGLCVVDTNKTRLRARMREAQAEWDKR